MRKGEWVRVQVNYPRNPRVNGVWEGKVIAVGRYRSGYAYFKLDCAPRVSFPNSSSYVKVLERRGGVA